MARGGKNEQEEETLGDVEWKIKVVSFFGYNLKNAILSLQNLVKYGVRL